jgi:hypothetical protein
MISKGMEDSNVQKGRGYEWINNGDCEIIHKYLVFLSIGEKLLRLIIQRKLW